MRPQEDLPALREEVRALKKQIETLQMSAATDRLERKTLRDQVTYLQSNFDAANRKLNDIYESRTWRTLIFAGKLLFSLADLARGVRRKLLHVANWNRSLFIRQFAANTDQIEISSDFPAPQSVTVLCGETEIRGWAAAKSGVTKLEILVGDRPLETVRYGLARPDVAAHVPGFFGSDRSGYKALVNARMFQKGRHDLRLIAHARSGRAQELICPVEIDPQSPYESWLERHALDKRLRDQLMAQMTLFSYRPKISVVTPVYKTPKEFLRRCIDSVRAQVYPNWELVLVDDDSRDSLLRELLLEYARKDERIRVSFQPKNAGIALTTNEGLKVCTGEFVAFLDHDDEIAANALFEVVNELNLDNSWDVFYSDEDKLTPDGEHKDPFFKPDWSPDLLRSENYVCHLLVCRRSLIEAVGGLRPGFDGSQDFDLILRVTEKTQKVRRIPKILYHWRISPSSTAGAIDQKPAASLAGLRALQDHLDRTEQDAIASEILPCRYRVQYPLKGEPVVEIIIPSGGNAKLETALRSVLEQSTYRKFRITVVDNSRNNSVERIVNQFAGGSLPIRMLDCRRIPFNFSFLCNQAAKTSQSPYLLFLNDDTSIITPDWMESMLEHAQRKEVGAVGALLLFPDDRIQHAGVLLGVYGMAGHSFRMMDSARHHYFCLPSLIRNCSAVTGACLLTRRETFFEVGGLEEAQLPLAFQDVDFCLKLHEKGYRIIYTPHAKLYHYESATKTKIAHQSEVDYMRARWRAYILDDPYYNPNLTRTGEDYSLNFDSNAGI
jgi:GT2 family glycosyltransferase